jgi:hypothetical protein
MSVRVPNGDVRRASASGQPVPRGAQDVSFFDQFARRRVLSGFLLRRPPAAIARPLHVIVNFDLKTCWADRYPELRSRMA